MLLQLFDILFGHNEITEIKEFKTATIMIKSVVNKSLVSIVKATDDLKESIKRAVDLVGGFKPAAAL